MAKDILSELEKLIGTLLNEANKPTDLEAGGPDFADRLKAVDAGTRFLVVKHKLVPPEKAKSMFEGMRDDLINGTPGGRAGPPPKGKNGSRVAPTPVDDDI